MVNASIKPIILAVCYAVAAPLFVLLYNVEAEAKTVFKMNHQFPASTAGSLIDKWFAEEIAKETDGEITIRIFWSDGLGGPQENLSMLKNGDIEMAAMSAGYYPDILRFHSAPNSIPMGMDNICQADVIMKALIDDIPEFNDEAERNGIRPLFFHLLNPYLLVSKKPITRFEDLTGLRIRTWGEDMPQLIKAAGAKPVNLFLTDIYEALKRNIIDAFPFSVDLVVSYNLYELAPNITEVVMWEGPSWGVWISLKAWKSLTDNQKKIFLTVSEKARMKNLPVTMAAEKKARTLLLEKGAVFHPFPENELKKWKEKNPDFFNNWIMKQKETGKMDAAEKTVELWKKLRIKTKCP